MTVKDLIEILRGHPQDMDVIVDMYSDSCLLEAKGIVVLDACLPRNDGWVENRRPDKELKSYLSVGR